MDVHRPAAVSCRWWLLLLADGPVELVRPARWWLWSAYRSLLVGYVVLVPQWRYLVHRWEVTETAVYTQTGWWARERRIAPMSRVQTVDHREGAIARLFGLATVRVTTASSRRRAHHRGARPAPRPRHRRRADPDGRLRARRRHLTWLTMDPFETSSAGNGSTRGCCWSTRSATSSASCRPDRPPCSSAAGPTAAAGGA